MTGATTLLGRHTAACLRQRQKEAVPLLHGKLRTCTACTLYVVLNYVSKTSALINVAVAPSCCEHYTRSVMKLCFNVHYCSFQINLTSKLKLEFQLGLRFW